MVAHPSPNLSPRVSFRAQPCTQVDRDDTETHDTLRKREVESPPTSPVPGRGGGGLKPERPSLCVWIGRVAMINLLNPLVIILIRLEKILWAAVTMCLYLFIPPIKPVLKQMLLFSLCT